MCEALPPMATGFFITLEGGEGTGKSTQAARLAKRLAAAGREVAATREPGGSLGAEAIRNLLVTGEVNRWSPLTEALLMNAARRDHLERVIIPALAAGKVVVCDRFADSTRAYQGAAGGVSPEIIARLEAIVVGDVRPDLTLILDLPLSTGLARAHARTSDESRFEAKGEAFHQHLRQAFLDIAHEDPRRCVVINAEGDPNQIEARLWAALEPRL